jgi:PHP family Zn ribbon phosphoesterase
MKLDALTSIKKDTLDTNALKSVTGGRTRIIPSGGGVYGGIAYSSDRTYEVEFTDIHTGELKWAYAGYAISTD